MISPRYGLEIDPDARTGDLPVGLQQRAEILKSLSRREHPHPGRADGGAYPRGAATLRGAPQPKATGQDDHLHPAQLREVLASPTASRSCGAARWSAADYEETTSRSRA
jgi:hypothetical protein